MLRSSPNQKLLRRSPDNGARPLFLKTFTLLTLVIALTPLIQSGSFNAHASGQANVAIIDNAFLPKHINVTTGTTVIWDYASNWSSLHTVTSVGNTTQGGPPPAKQWNPPPRPKLQLYLLPTRRLHLPVLL